MPTMNVGMQTKASAFESFSHHNSATSFNGRKLSLQESGRWFDSNSRNKKSRSSIGRCIRLLTGGFWVRVPAGLQWMNSSTAERRFVRPLVESSNLSSSAIVSATKLEGSSGL